MVQLNPRGRGWWASVLLSLAVIAAPSVAFAALIVVSPGDDLQAAVDSASPGDTILLTPGVYTGTPNGESLVTVTTDNLTIRGSTSAVIDATGFENGILVGGNTGTPSPLGCPPIAVRNFSIQGLTIKNAEDTGLRLIAVDGFRITQGVYLDNEEYGPFPICSRNGEIAQNFASGHKDAAIYVGDDDNVVVRNNIVTASAIGIEIENSINSTVRNNVLSGNTAGILVVVLPGLPMPFTENVLIMDNVIVDNNLPNPGGGLVGMFLPTGTGILNVGGDGVEIKTNTITGNDSFGVGIIGNPFVVLDARIEPFVDDNEVRNNTILNNGSNPDPVRALTPGADIVFVPDVLDLFDVVPGDILAVDPDPTDNCFANNAFNTDFPPGIVGLFPCNP